MATIKIVFPTPTDNISDSADLDILLYNGTLGSEVLFETILKDDIRKSIVGSNIEITGIEITEAVEYNFSAKARDEAGNLSVNFSPITTHEVSLDIDSLMNLINLQSDNVDKFTIIPTDKVSVWTEQNGTTTWNQATDANRPLRSNGIVFDQTNDFLARSSDLTATDYSFYCVVRYLAVNTGTTGNRALFSNLAATDWIGFQNGYIMTLNTASVLKRTISSGYKGNRHIVLGVRKSGNNFTFTINDRVCIQSEHSTVANTIFGRINGIAGFPQFFANMNVKSFCLSSTVFSDVQHRQITDYLYNRYNLSSNTTADNVIAFGDSNTVGILSTSYVNSLASSLGLAHLNLGIAGTVFVNTTGQTNNGYDRYEKQIVTKPYTDYISITYSGTNDILYGIPASVYGTQMNSMIADLISKGYNPARICISSPAYQRSGGNAAELDNYRSQIVSIALTHGIKYFDLLQAMRDGGGDALLNSGDNVHLNNTGQTLWANGVYAAFTS